MVNPRFGEDRLPTASPKHTERYQLTVPLLVICSLLMVAGGFALATWAATFRGATPSSKPTLLPEVLRKSSRHSLRGVVGNARRNAESGRRAQQELGNGLLANFSLQQKITQAVG